MSEEKKSRSTAEVRSDYTKAALQLGQAQYQIAVHSKEASNLLSLMQNLNLEAASIAQAEAKAASEASSSPVEAQ